MAEINVYVDPDATGSGTGADWTNAYIRLSLAEAGAQASYADLVADGNTIIFNCRSSAGSADGLTQLAIAGWTVDSTHFITVIAATGHEALKSGWSTSRYRLSSSTTGTVVAVSNNYTVVKGLQVECTTGGRRTVGLSGGAINVVGCVVDSCRLRSDNVYAFGGIIEDISTGTNTIQNCILEGVGTDGAVKPLIFSDNGTTYVYNCVGRGNNAGPGFAESSDGAIIAVNCAVFNTTDDFDDVLGSVTNCASDDGTGTNPQTPSGADWDNEFTDPANGNFTLLNTGNLYNTGVGPSVDALVPTLDIDGDTRSGTTCDIGVDEYVSGVISGTLPINFSVLDSFSCTKTMNASISESISMQDSGINNTLFTSSISEVFILSDIVNNIMTLISTISENIVFTDSMIGDIIGAIQCLIDESFIISDINSARNDALASISESLNIEDTNIITKTLQGLLSENVNISDDTLSNLIILVSLAESLNIVDESDIRVNFSVNINETIQISDAISKIALLQAIITETFNITDIIVETSQLPNGKVSITFIMKIPDIQANIKTATITFNLV